jgi:hypothetical protein
MNNLCWEVFKNTGNIEAYLYLRDRENLRDQNESMGEINNSDDSIEQPGDST